MKAEKVRVSGELLGHSEEAGDGLLQRIVTGDETSVHHYDSEKKRQSMKHHHIGSPMPKKFKTKASAGEDMFTVFWNSVGVVLTDFQVKGVTVNSQRYTETVKNLKKCITRKGGRN
jgi:hypothetical protein